MMKMPDIFSFLGGETKSWQYSSQEGWDWEVVVMAWGGLEWKKEKNPQKRDFFT